MTQAVSLAAFAARLQSGGLVPRTAMADTDTGKVDFFMRATAPTGWVAANGGPIGSAASGGTLRANDDTLNLFTVLWALNATDFPIQTSAGGGATRGASAAADWALNRRIVVRDMRAEFIRGLDNSRGVDTGRVLGSAQAQDIQSHTHNTGGDNLTVSAGAQSVRYGGTGALATSATGGTETRPRNVALLVCVKL